MQKSTTIPISGNKQYKQAIKAVAAAKGMNMCDLVRKAVDAYCGTELEPHLLFFAQGGSKNFQMETQNEINNPQSEEKEHVLEPTNV